nr:hypothetical protein [Tanacetum cinerariifolium]
MTPFKAIYSREASSIHEYSPGTNVTASIDATLIEHQQLTEILKEALDRSRHRMTKQANKHRMEKHFKWVTYSIYVSATIVKHPLKQGKIKNYLSVILVRIKFWRKLDPSPSSEFPTEWLTNSPSLEPQPENILQRRITGNKEEVLVKWKHHDTSEATWEDWLEFMHRFPIFVGHEDMSVVQGDTNDTLEPSAAVQTKAAQDKARPIRIIKKPARYLE